MEGRYRVAIRSQRTVLILMTLSGAISPVHAAMVPLVSGSVHPAFDSPVGGFPFDASAIDVMTDNDLTTSYSFTSSAGQYDQPGSVSGIAERFDFDLSQYSQVESIDFTWTGSVSSTGINLTTEGIEIGWGTYVNNIWAIAPQTTIFPTGVATASASFYSGGDFYHEIDSVIDGSLASVLVTTDLGSSSPDSGLQSITLDTFEVTANVTGVLATVSEPAVGWLLLSGLGSLAAMSRRRRTEA